MPWPLSSPFTRKHPSCSVLSTSPLKLSNPWKRRLSRLQTESSFVAPLRAAGDGLHRTDSLSLHFCPFRETLRSLPLPPGPCPAHWKQDEGKKGRGARAGFTPTRGGLQSCPAAWVRPRVPLRLSSDKKLPFWSLNTLLVTFEQQNTVMLPSLRGERVEYRQLLMVGHCRSTWKLAWGASRQARASTRQPLPQPPAPSTPLVQRRGGAILAGQPLIHGQEPTSLRTTNSTYP